MLGRVIVIECSRCCFRSGGGGDCGDVFVCCWSVDYLEPQTMTTALIHVITKVQTAQRTWRPSEVRYIG